MGSYEAEFVWTGPASSVIVTGTFDNWSRSVQMAKGDRGFNSKVRIPYGQKTDYKFIVDGRWLVNDNFPTEWDGAGNVNNYVMAPSEPPPSVMAANTTEPVKATTAPELVTPVGPSGNVAAALTPLVEREPRSPALPVYPAPNQTKAPTDKQAKVNEPASSLKSPADATNPSSALLAVKGVVTPSAAATRERVVPPIVPLLDRPLAPEPVPTTRDEKEKLSPAMTSAVTTTSPVITSAQDAVAPAVHAAQEVVPPLDAVYTAVATVPEAPAADAPAANGGPVSSEPSDKHVASGSPSSKPNGEAEHPSSDAATESPVVSTVLVVASSRPIAVDISASPVEPAPKSPATPPPSQAPAQAPTTPIAAASIPVPETPQPAAYAKDSATSVPKDGGLSTEPSSTFNASTVTTPTKRTPSHKRHPSLGRKLFSRRSSGSSDTEGSPGRDTRKDGKKRTSFIETLKNVFKHDHSHHHPNPNGTEVSKEH